MKYKIIKSWIFYILGDLSYKISYIFPFEFLGNWYQFFMNKSSKSLEDKSGKSITKKGPWNDVSFKN